ncbi:MAG TPA: glycosyltransferase family 4 protein [Azospirillum sp.]|nr:glycosyltransferase family 4 protein [Azospirillum sp.]
MNILLLNHYAGSDRLGMEYRPFYLAREWVASDHKVTVIGASYSHLRTHQPTVPADLTIDEEEGVRFRWVRTGRYSGNGIRRVASMATFVSKLYAYADRIAREERPDVVICSSTYPLDIYPGARIARKVGARLVFEVHDLWPLTPMLLGGYSPRHPYIQAMQHAEDYAYRCSDTVVSILPHARDYMVGRGLEPAKFVHIPNGIPVAAFLGAPPATLPTAITARIAEERARGHFLVGYAGGINPSNPIETILEAAAFLRDEPISFILIGGGTTAREFKARVEEAALPNFHYMGVIPKGLVQRFLAEMDVLTMPWWRSPIYRFGVSPNKMFDYMLAGRPIVQSCDASNDLVTEAQCGTTVPPEDPKAFANAILRLSRMPPAERTRLGENGRRFVLEHHDYRILASRFIAAAAPTRAEAAVRPGAAEGHGPVAGFTG